MRQIKDLVRENKHVWVYLSTDEVKDRFIKGLIKEGFTWCNGNPISVGMGGYLFGIRSDMTVAYLSCFIWCMSFQGVKLQNGTLPLRVDYEKYESGEEDYICRESHFKGYMTVE